MGNKYFYHFFIILVLYLIILIIPVHAMSDSTKNTPIVQVIEKDVNNDGISEIIMDNGLIHLIIYPKKGGRVFNLQLTGKSNIAHQDWGMISDHPLGIDWDQFRDQPYSYTVISKNSNIGKVKLSCSISGKGKVEKTITLHANEQKIDVDYAITNLGSKLDRVKTVFTSFMAVDQRYPTPIVGYAPWKKESADTELPNSDIGIYDKYDMSDLNQSWFEAYNPKTDITLRVSTSDTTITEIATGTAEKYYLSLELHYLENWRPNETKWYHTTLDLTSGTRTEKIVQFLKGYDQFQEKKETVSAVPYPNQKMGITGAFINLGGLLERYADQAMMEKEMDAFRAIKFDTVIIDSAYPDSAFFPSKIIKPYNPTLDPIEKVCAYADKYGIQVHISIGALSDDWESMNTVQLNEVANKQKQVIAELNQRYSHHKSFAGWYIPYELCDAPLRIAERRQKVCGFFAVLADYCHKLTPGKAVSIAPYFTTNLVPTEFSSFWQEVITACHVDILMMQDSIGAVNVSSNEEVRFKYLPAYYAALYQACKTANVKFWTDLEVFRQIHGIPVDTKPWSGEPAPFERVKRQIEIEQQYVEKIVCFDYPHYLSPNNPLLSFGDKGKKLYNTYREYIKTVNK